MTLFIFLNQFSSCLDSRIQCENSLFGMIVNNYILSPKICVKYARLSSFYVKQKIARDGPTAL